eukprot:Rmarinus@m.16271
MFRKELNIVSNAPLRTSDSRKKVQSFIAAFPGAEEALSNIFSEENAQLFTSKAKVKNAKITIYAVGTRDSKKQTPLFFENRDKLFPSLYFLALAPDALESLYVHPHVSQFLLNGADLMLPGVLVPEGGLGDFHAGAIRSVKVLGNPVPVAVGTMIVGSDTIVRAGMVGKGLEVCHCFRDALWAWGPKTLPNDGFDNTSPFVRPSSAVLAAVAASSGDGECDGDGEGEGGDNADGGADETNNCRTVDPVEGCSGEPASGVPPEAPGSPDLNAVNTVSEANSTTVTEALENVSIANDDGTQDSGSTPVNTKAMDDLLEFCFCKAVKTSVNDKDDLPIPCSRFWSQHLLPARPEDSRIDLAQSSYKKVSKFFQHLSSEKLVRLKTTKFNSGDASIEAINRNHPKIKSFDTSALPSSHGGSSAANTRKNPALTPLYKPRKGMEEIFPQMAYYTHGDVRGTLYHYANDNQLFTGAASEQQQQGKKKRVSGKGGVRVSMTEALREALLCGKKKPSANTAVADEQTADLDDLTAAFEAAMQRHTGVTNVQGETVVKKGTVTGLIFTTENRSGNKAVTIITNFEPFGFEASDLAQELQRKCACSATLTTTKTGVPGILVQGNVTKTLVEYLSEKYAVGSNFFDIKDKCKKKAH